MRRWRWRPDAGPSGAVRAALLGAAMGIGTLAPLVPAVVAQEATPSAIPAVAPLPPPPALSDESSRPLTGDDVTVNGLDASTSFFVPLPAWSANGGGTLDLAFSHSPLLRPDVSTMTVAVNGESVASVLLTPDNADRARLSVPLPADGVAGSVAVQLRFRMRLTEDDCEDPRNPALWTTVHRDSTVSLMPTPVEAAPTLADVPALFTAPIDGAAPAIALPAAPTAEETEAAGMVAFQLGRWAGRANRDAAVQVIDGEAPPGTPVVLVGVGAALPPDGDWGDLAWQGDGFVLDGAPVPDDRGVLAVRWDDGPKVLVSGATPAAVLQAARALAAMTPEAPFGQAAAVAVGDPADPPADVFAWSQGAASFAQLGLGRRDVFGPGDHFIDLGFERPAGWTLQEGGSLQLLMETSPAARADTSWVRALVNGIDVGSQPLQPGETGVQRYIFGLPGGLLNAGLDGQPQRDLALQVRLFLDYPEQPCVAIDPDAVWASLLPTSVWILPHDRYAGLDLGRFPSGFLDADVDVPVDVVLPADADSAQTEAGLAVAAALGRWNPFSRTPLPRLVPADGLSDEQRGDGPLIAIGDASRNAVSAAAVEAGGEAFAPLPPAAYAVAPDGPVGVLRLGPSPWADGRPLLMVAGGDGGAGLDLAARALGREAVLGRIQGTGIVVAEGLAPQAVAGARPANAAPSDLAPFVIPDERPWIERIPPWQVVGAVLLLTVVGLVVGVVSARWVRAGRRA